MNKQPEPIQILWDAVAGDLFNNSTEYEKDRADAVNNKKKREEQKEWMVSSNKWVEEHREFLDMDGEKKVKVSKPKKEKPEDPEEPAEEKKETIKSVTNELNNIEEKVFDKKYDMKNLKKIQKSRFPIQKKLGGLVNKDTDKSILLSLNDIKQKYEKRLKLIMKNLGKLV